MRKNDIILMVFVLAIAIVGFFLIKVLDKTNTNAVKISVDGENHGIYSLDENNVIEIDTEYGHNQICIEDGKVHMSEADCPDGYCKKQGSIGDGSKSIICLPHKLVVEVIEEEDTNSQVDVVSK